ncbi:Hpt domain-containing protein [Marinitoga hydrogenitolerans DSM 16785]|uniref:histidine kinase n=2 Tax=Marinitoga TaxID=160798 RepID=A0A1M4UJL4_MARH1|nr:Hpt domain-containing protein [Marinitoga hydrogenitolerans DSM 16785]
MIFFIIIFSISIFGTTLKVGIYNTPPFFYTENGNFHYIFKGFVVDLLREIAKQEKWNIEFIYGTKAELENKLDNNEIDLLPKFFIEMFVNEKDEKTKLKNGLFLTYMGVLHKKDIEISKTKNKIFVLKKGDFLTDFYEVFSELGKIIEVNTLEEKIDKLKKDETNFAIIPPKDMEKLLHNLFGFRMEVFPIRLLIQNSNNLNQGILDKIDDYLTEYKNDKNSIYYKLLDEYIYGVTMKIPKWLYYLFMLFMVIFIAVFFTAAIYKMRYEKSLIKLKKHNDELNLQNKITEDLLKMNKRLFIKFSKIVSIISEFSESKYTIQQFSKRILSEILEIIPEADYGSVMLKNKNKVFFLSAVGHNLEMLRKIHMVSDNFKEGINSKIVIADNILDKYDGINKEILENASKQIKKSAIYSVKIKDDFYINICIDKKDENDFSKESLEILEILGNLSSIYFKNRIFLALSINEKKKAEKAGNIKTEFLANMSHDIRTPLNGIIGMIYILKNTKVNDLQKKYLDMLNNSAKLLSSLVNDILDLSKLESNEIYFEEIYFDIEKEIAEIIDTNAYIAYNKGLELNFYVDENIPKVLKGDTTKLKQILNNLVNNAIKFTEKGEVYLKVTTQKKNMDLNDIIINFEVIDTGIGIRNENIKKIFQPFVQEKSKTSRLYGGTGLGLSIVYKLVKLMNGEIEVMSVPNIGTTFLVKLPFKIESRESFEIDEIIKFSEKNVLIVDDNKTNRFIIRKYIESLSMKCVEARNGIEALKKLKLKRYDILLTDRQMPEMTGLELAEEMNKDKDLKKVKKILLSSILNKDGDIEIEIKYYKFDAIIGKPVKRNDLINSIISIFKPEIIKQKNDEEKIKISNEIKILYVDDDEINREVGRIIIESLGPTVITVENGEEAIEMIKNNYFDIVFMDIQMPVMNGYEATKKIREFNKSIPIIAMTAHLILQYKEEAIKSGMNDFITKPIEIERLLQIIKKYCKSLNKKFIENQDERIFLQNTHFDKEEFMKRVLNKRDLALKILEKYIDDTEKNIKKLKIALDKDEEENIKFYAHTIKGSSRNVSANKLAKIAEKIEINQNKKNTEKNFEELLGEFEILKEIIEKFLKDGGIKNGKNFNS